MSKYIELLNSNCEIRYLVGENEYKISGIATCVLGFDSENKLLVVKSSKGDVACINISIITEIRIKKPVWSNEKRDVGVNYG